jgi:hypothetical protein
MEKINDCRAVGIHRGFEESRVGISAIGMGFLASFGAGAVMGAIWQDWRHLLETKKMWKIWARKSIGNTKRRNNL